MKQKDKHGEKRRYKFGCVFFLLCLARRSCRLYTKCKMEAARRRSANSAILIRKLPMFFPFSLRFFLFFPIIETHTHTHTHARTLYLSPSLLFSLDPRFSNWKKIEKRREGGKIFSSLRIFVAPIRGKMWNLRLRITSTITINRKRYNSYYFFTFLSRSRFFPLFFSFSRS